MGKKVEHQGIKGGCSLENIQLPLADDRVVTLGSVVDFPECKAVAEVSTSVLWREHLWEKSRTSREGVVLKIFNSRVKGEEHYVCITLSFLRL